MAALPEEIPEVGSIHVSVGLSRSGTGTAFSLEGLSYEEALGHLSSVTDEIRRQIQDRWEAAQYGDEIEIFAIECPHCGHEIMLNGEDDDGEEESEDALPS